jgi:hypothetical protein
MLDADMPQHVVGQRAQSHIGFTVLRELAAERAARRAPAASEQRKVSYWFS